MTTENSLQTSVVLHEWSKSTASPQLASPSMYPSSWCFPPWGFSSGLKLPKTGLSYFLGSTYSLFYEPHSGEKENSCDVYNWRSRHLPRNPSNISLQISEISLPQLTQFKHLKKWCFCLSVNNMYFSRMFLLRCRPDELTLGQHKSALLKKTIHSLYQRLFFYCLHTIPASPLLFYSTAGVHLCHVIKLLRKLQQVKINNFVNGSLL